MVQSSYLHFITSCLYTFRKQLNKYLRIKKTNNATNFKTIQKQKELFPPDCKEGKMVELDVVTESMDKKHILIGECKWTHDDDDADRLLNTLAEKVKYLPFIKKGQEVHLVLFLKESPHKRTKEMRIILPEDVIKA